jgi:uncharacterized membrane protein
VGVIHSVLVVQSRTAKWGLTVRKSVTFVVPAMAVLMAVGTASPVSAAIAVGDMGTLPGTDFSQATSVRDDGAAVGYAMASTGGRRAVLWQASGPIELQTPGRNSEAFDIDTAGVIVGEAEPADLQRPIPVWWDTTGALTELPGHYYGSARGVNDAGVIVGVSDNEGQWAMRWENTSTAPTRLATLPGGENDAVAYDVNNDGVAVGHSRGPDGSRHAVVWDAVGGISALDTPSGYTECRALALNDAGLIAGSCGTASRDYAAVRWDPTGTATVLPAFGTSYSEAVAVSDAGLIVGAALDTDGRYRPVRWGAYGAVTALATLGGQHGIAMSINDNGTIVGRTMLPDSTSFRATRWRNAG